MNKIKDMINNNKKENWEELEKILRDWHYNFIREEGIEKIKSFIRTKKIEWEKEEREKVCIEWAKELKEFIKKGRNN